MTDRTHYCAGCKGREDIIGKLEAEVERLTLTVRKLQGHQGALEADNARLREALNRMVYETTHLSPMKPNGDHDCTIKADALAQARAALQETSHD